MDILDAMFEHVRNCGMELDYVRQVPGYAAAEQRREPLLDDLTAALSSAGRKILEDYLLAEREISFAEELALFRCGLTVGLALGTMAGERK